MGFAVHYEDFGGTETGVIVGTHGVAVGSGVVKSEDVAFGDFADFSIVAEGVRFADVADYGVNAGGYAGLGDVFDAVPGVVKHGAYEMIHAGIDSGEDCGSCLFDYVYFGEEISGFADEEFARFEH